MGTPAGAIRNKRGEDYDREIKQKKTEAYEEQALLAGVWSDGRRKVSSESLGQITAPLLDGNVKAPARTPFPSQLKNCSWDPRTKAG